MLGSILENVIASLEAADRNKALKHAEGKMNRYIRNSGKESLKVL